MLFKVMHKTVVLIILVAVLITYGNVLSNGFVGDDEVVIVRNTFYRSLDNLPRLFSQDYTTRGSSFSVAVDQDNGSGSVAYRPVLSLTYFLDYQVWKLNPAGYHLTNIILHFLNSILVYFILFHILQKYGISLFCALLFCVHPIQVEAVSNIGYRADVLSTFFLLCSFLSYLRCDTKKYFHIFSLVTYFLALFTKESVIVFPVLLMTYDYFFRDSSIKKILSNLKSRYIGFICITLFYLYTYFYIFPNSALNIGKMAEISLSARLVTMAYIFLGYIKDLCLPFAVQMLPALYTPIVDEGWIVKVLFFVILFGTLLFGVLRSKVKLVSFSLAWFLITLVPVSNIIPITNPMAHRFLYLPSIGFLTFVGILLYQFCSNPKYFQKLTNLGNIIRFGFIALCMIMTIPLNSFWKNNFMVARELMESHPQNGMGYFLYGSQLFKAGEYEQARFYLEKSLELGKIDQRAYYLLGVSYTNEPEKAKKYFRTLINLYPDYPSGYLGLGRLILFEGEYKKALPYFQKSLELLPTYSGYAYLMQSYLLSGEQHRLRALYEESRGYISDQDQINSLQKFSLLKSLERPIDIGI